MKAAAYTRVSSREQELEGLSLAEQRARLMRECEHRAWTLDAIVTESITGTGRRRRPSWERLLEQLDAGDYDVLIVTRLDRISRSLLEFCQVLARSEAHGWKLVMLDPQVDTTTPYGMAMAQMGAVFAQLEAALTSQRTKEGLAYARARGTFDPGATQRYRNADVIELIMRWHRRGLGGIRIAARLEREGVPAPNGATWHPRTVRRIITRETSS